MDKMVNGAGQEVELERPKLKLKVLLESPNIAKLLPKEYLDCLGSQVVEGYAVDRTSRNVWEQRNEKAIKLALQVVEAKSFPWENCSNVKFPLVTIAALQFLSRVAILTKGRQIVKCDVLGPDHDGKIALRAKRIASHLSFQLLEENDGWVDDDEKAKFAASIVGCAFKKTFFDPVEGLGQSQYVPASLLVVDYYTKDIDKASRITHELTMTRNDLVEREKRGVFLKMDDEAPATGNMTQANLAQDLIQGISQPQQSSLAMYTVLEQHLWLDLDGDDIKEPYIAFVRYDTKQVLRVVARYFDNGDIFRRNDTLIRKLQGDMLEATDEPQVRAHYKAEIAKLRDAHDNWILRIVPQKYFTKIPFIPSPDGGFYDLGLGAVLGPLNESVNSLVNQLIDNGTMQTTAGGFLGRGVKMKGGSSGFAPFEWKPVDSNGDDLRKNIVPLPVQAPSNVLFELLGMLVNYGERITGSTDIMSGVSPGQNTPAETSRNTVEQGMKIFSGIYGRMHRAFRRELQKLVALNELYLEDTANFFNLTTGEGAMIGRKDYVEGKFSVRPAADPATASETQRQEKAMMLAERAGAVPGYNRYAVEVNLLEAFDVPNLDMLFPDPKGPNAVPPPVNPKIDLELKKLELKNREMEQDVQLAIVGLQQQAQLTAAKIQELEAKATKELAEANGVDIGHQIAAIEAQIGAAKAHQEGIVSTLTLMQKAIEHKHQVEVSHAAEANGNSSKA